MELLETRVTGPLSAVPPAEGVLGEAAGARQELAALRSLVGAVRSANVRAASATRRAEARKATEDAEAAQAAAAMAAAALRRRVAAIRAAAVSRAEISVVAGLENKLIEQVNELAAIRAEVRACHRATLQRRLFAVSGTSVPDKDVDRILDAGGGTDADDVFRAALKDDGERRAVLEELTRRHDAIEEVERKTHELQAIVVDLATLVEEQGDAVDNIEAQVSRSAEYTAAGARALVVARQHQKRARRRLCMAGLTVVVVAAAVGLVVGLGVAL